MTEEKPKQETEEKAQEKLIETKSEAADAKVKTGKQEAKEEPKEEVKKDKEKEFGEKEKPRKEQAIAYGKNLHASKKQCAYISKFIKNKPIDTAISDLQSVIKLKIPVPFKGEVPHRKGKGIMSGRYPIKASKLFINVLRGLKGNVLVNSMDLDKTRIHTASASWASRPLRRGNVQAKRTNIIITAREAKSNTREKRIGENK